MRRDFHKHPELGYQEVRTSGIVAEKMAKLGYEVRRNVGKTGVLAQRGREGRTLLLRADMDALPVWEENDVEYRSTNDGVMHACGHDGHMSIALMAAARLAGASFPGRVRFAFQPAEEGGQGADRMIEEGALDDVDAAIGLHLWSHIPIGKIGITIGPAMASVDEFTLEVRGHGCHAAMPHEGIDPIVTGTQIVQEFQAIVSRGVSPLESAVVSVTKFHAGSAFNVIPERAELSGTVRTFSESVRDHVHERMRKIVGDRGKIDIVKKTRVLVNDAKISAVVHRAATEVVGEENILHDQRTMGGEDFSSFLAAVPGCFFFVGAAPHPNAEPHHSPRFNIDERAMALGLEVMTRAAQLYWKTNA
ncbi:MAG TPA: amidohydrolase [bacterium]|nr:amidohydrolase [bacterium]